MSSRPGSGRAAAWVRLAVSVVLAAGLPGGPPARAAGNREQEAIRLPFPEPESHRGNWLQFHGTVAPLGWKEAGGEQGECLTCHKRSDCSNCHNTRPPRDHTSSWRLRTHGFAAGANNERCQACHRQDMCVRCHNETPPRSHRGNWLTDAVSGHCAWCHIGPGKTVAADCVVCHKRQPH